MPLTRDQVYCAKPSSSRHASVEAFVVARGYRLPEGFDAPRFSGMALGFGSGGLGHGTVTEEERRDVPFVACGDLGGYDDDEAVA